MKIRLEITQDNGKSKEFEIIGNPEPDTILNLVNQLLSLYYESTTSSQQAAVMQQHLKEKIMPQANNVLPQESPEPSFGSKHPQLTAGSNNHTLQPAQFQNMLNQFVQQKMKGQNRLKIAEEEYSKMKNESLTIKERLELFLNFEYKDSWFTSLDVKRDYDKVYDVINLSTVSTYLSRLYREGKLERKGNRNQRKYCIRAESKNQEYPVEYLQHHHIRP